MRIVRAFVIIYSLLGLNNSGSNSTAGLFATQFAPESSQNNSLSFSPSDSFSTGSHSWVEEGERTRPDATQSSSGDQGNPKSEHTGQVTMNGFGQSTNGDANAGQPLTNGPVVEFEFKRNANSNNNNNNNSFEGASMNNKATSSGNCFSDIFCEDVLIEIAIKLKYQTYISCRFNKKIVLSREYLIL